MTKTSRVANLPGGQTDKISAGLLLEVYVGIKKVQGQSLTEFIIGLAAFYAWARAKHFGCHSVCLSFCHNGKSLSGHQT